MKPFEEIGSQGWSRRNFSVKFLFEGTGQLEKAGIMVKFCTLPAKQFSETSSYANLTIGKINMTEFVHPV